MKKVNASLRPIVGGLNLPTVIKTAIGSDGTEYLFIATQVGEIYQIGKGELLLF
jgi:hypothetical protein